MRVSGGTSDPTFELSEVLELPDNCVCFVDNVAIPHSWGAVTESNKYLYLAERAGASSPYQYLSLIHI